MKKNMGERMGDYLQKLNRVLVRRIEKEKKIFYTEHKRPQKSADYKIESHDTKPGPGTAIVLQGPLVSGNDFTLETIRIYKKNFRNSNIIVSTWIDESKEIIEQIEKENVTVVLSEKPFYAGISNINYQITSSINGIMKAKELGARYVIKSRTDHRIYAVNVMEFFLNLLKAFPLQEAGIQKERLVIPNLNTFLYRMYGVSDMTMFGNIEDMILYWDAVHDKRVMKPDTSTIKTVDDFAKMRACEIYLCTEFMKKISKIPLWTIEDSWNVYAKHFCVIDHSSIDIYWPKYLRFNEYRNLYYNSYHTHQLLKFSDWLSLYNGSYVLPDEEILNYGEGKSFN